LGWPEWRDISAPSGAGPRVYAELAERKMGQVLRSSGIPVEVGVLAADPASSTSEAPLAVVCRFARHLGQPQLATVLRLAWSFCRTPLLVTIEPTLIRAWTCYERPPDKPKNWSPVEALQLPLSDQAAQSLHWCELASGSFLRRNAERFQSKQRADVMLLGNLKDARRSLHDDGLDYDYIHPLLARLIFVQFLFHRKDSDGNAALNGDVLGRLHQDDILAGSHNDLSGILLEYNDAYRFFRWLNDKFNGDLFPGKAGTIEEREAEWAAEMEAVKPHHLAVLSQFVSGTLAMEDGQHSLWPLYSFDAIPLEFISSIYQEFVRGAKDSTGAHYTRSHLVDLVLDGVLPWGGEDWNLRILDPACGSGIFLVKAFQRLVHRWRNAHPGVEPTAKLLRHLLERNVAGIDINEDAVRVASFSLYLAMCDEIDPKWYWSRVKFPVLRGQTLVHADFFRDDIEGFRTAEDAGTYDVVVGNAPWGKKSATPTAIEWARTHDGWPVVNKQLGTLFLPKAAALTKTNGYVSMLQPAGGLLFNREETCLRFRQKLFASFRVEEIINLAALRFKLFPESVSPVCAITLRPVAPDGGPISYCCPKETHTTEDDYCIAVDPHDISEVLPDEAALKPWIWSALAWGGRRDIALLRRLKDCTHISDIPSVNAREGLIRGDRKRQQACLMGRRCLEARGFPLDTFLRLSANSLPVNQDPATDAKASTDFSAFCPPQLIVKQTWSKKAGRFRAAVVDAQPGSDGILCSQSYVSVHAASEETLEAACLSLNSRVAPYYLLLTSGRFASYRPEVLVKDLLDVPIPPSARGLLTGLENDADIDDRAREAFEFNEVEWALVEDLSQYTLPDFKGDGSSPGRQPTQRLSGDSTAENEPDLRLYADYFLRVLEAGFGADKGACVTIFHDAEQQFPLRILALHLGHLEHDRIGLEPVSYGALADRLAGLTQALAGQRRREGAGVEHRRVLRVYDTAMHGGQVVPTVYIVKPDQLRYWTRSAALRDADSVAADIMLWRAPMAAQPGGNRG
jgi:hypothetical protein